MEDPDYLRAILSLGFVIGLILLAGWAGRKWDLRSLSQRLQYGKRLKVLEQLPLDARRKISIIQCDTQQYLLVSGAASEQLIPLSSSEVPHE